MSLANFADYKSKITSPYQRTPISKVAAAGTAGHPMSWWAGSSGVPAAGATSASPALCDNTTVGAITARNAATELRAFIRQLGVSQSGGGASVCTIFLADRLAHWSGLVMTSTTPQTVGTPAITRYNPSTDKLHAAYEIWVATGNGATFNLTFGYTNQAGTSSQVAPVIPVGFGPPGVSAVGSFCPMPFVSGDVGVQSVDTMTLSGSLVSGTTGCCIYKTLAMFTCYTNQEEVLKFDPVEKMGGLMPLIKPNACLFFYGYNAGTAVTLTGDIEFFED